MQNRIPLAAHIAVLLAILFGAVWAFTYFSGSALKQFYIVIAAVTIHVAWGVLYHLANKKLTLGLILEYVLVSVLVLLLFSWAFLFS